jgi:hypothetical protein
MARRSWWAAAGVAFAVMLIVGTAVVMASGDAEPGVGERGAERPGVAGRASSAGGAAMPGSPNETPPLERPHRSVVAPRDQPTRPDVPLTLSIQSYEVLAPERLQFRYAVGVPECYGTLDRAVVKETDQEVVVVLTARPPRGPADQPCPDIALVKDTVVGLDAPLGDRRVVDGVSGEVVHRGHTDLY